MNEAIKTGKEYFELSHGEFEGRSLEDLKPEVNNLLHVFLPGDMTLHDVELIAATITDIILLPKEFLRKVKSEKL